jgi:hypothetical protein
MKLFALLFSITSLFALPSWVHDPTMGGEYVGVVGIVPKMQNPATQERIALLNAKSELSQIVHVEVEAVTTIESDDFGEESAFEDTLKSQSVMKTTVLEKFIDQNGTLYLWLIQQKGK